jgi:hypothetical protein
MLWNTKIIVSVLIALLFCWVCPAVAAEVCPPREKQPLRSVDVFDGSPEELATLVPDVPGERSGYWKLGYLYDLGRFVTIRCKYADGETVDVKFSNRVDRCDYKIDRARIFRLNCR